MIPRTDEPTEGVVFDVQDHTRRTGTSGPIHMGIWLVQTSMGLKSPSDGFWDGRGRTTLWWAFAQRRQRDVPPGHHSRTRPRGDHPLKMGQWILMDRMPPEAAGRFLEHVAVCWDHLARVEACKIPKGANVLLSGCWACPKRANVSLRGAWHLLLSSFFWHF